MRARDVMTPHVITIDADASVQALARLLCEREISGVPVVNPDGQLVGIVSEGDLLHRAETGTERRVESRRSRWLDAIASDDDLAREYVKSHGRKVKDVMTANVISVPRHDGSRRCGNAARNEKGQAGPGRSRRQNRWHYQQGEPRTGLSGDPGRPRGRHWQRRSNHSRQTAGRADGTRMVQGSAMVQDLGG